jgi:hypothetical protein
MLNLFQHPTRWASMLSKAATRPVGCRNKFGMTLGIYYFSIRAQRI